jgi:hypothetical protein
MGWFSMKVDIDSIFLIVSAFSGNPPFPNITDIQTIIDPIVQGKRMPLDQDWPDIIRKIIQEAWSQDIRLRPSFRQITKNLLQEMQTLQSSGTYVVKETKFESISEEYTE